MTQYPLTTAQQWLLAAYATTQLPPQVRWYRLAENQSVASVRAALECILLTEPALRLRLTDMSGEWKQEDLAAPLYVTELEAPDEDPLAWAQRAAVEDDRVAPEPFSQAIAAVIVRSLSGRELFLGVRLDRFVSDGRGFDVLERALDAALAGSQTVTGRRVAPDEVPSLVAPAAFRNTREVVESLADRLLAATTASRKAPAAEAAGLRRHVVVQPPATAVKLLEGCRAASISPTMAYAAAQAVILTRAFGTTSAVLNLVVGNRSRRQQHVIGNFSTVTHIAVPLDGTTTVRDLRSRAREATLNGIRERDVDPVALYRRLYARMPTWPPGWNAFCNVRDGLRWTEPSALTSVDVQAPDEADRLPGMLTANVRIAPEGALAEWIWDDQLVPAPDATAFEDLVLAIGTLDDNVALVELPSVPR